MTLEELQESMKEEIQNPNFKYTPGNILIKLGEKYGNLCKFGFKRRNPGIAKDDKEEGDQKVQIEIGKMAGLLAAFCETNKFSLEKCREMAAKAVTEKRAAKADQVS